MASYGVSQDVIPGNLTIQGNLYQTAVQDGIVAKAGGGQQTTGSSVLNPAINWFRVTTAASPGDSVTLYPATSGDEAEIRNDGASSINVFPAAGQNFNTGSANAAFAVGAGKAVYLFCITSGTWLTNLSA